MSEFFASLIPTDPSWQPVVAAAAAAKAYVRQIFPDPDAVSQEITVRFYDHVTIVDAGEYLERITCPACAADIPLAWLGELVEEHGVAGFTDLSAAVPCCGRRLGLDTLGYDLPCGFARFEIAVRDPARVEDGFSPREQEVVAGLLGHPVRQILAHI
jgi:hypothetical protein